jgi:hypothetical protein
VPTTARAETGRELCAVQVKGGKAAPIVFGGYDDEKKADRIWQSHEIEWLRTLNVPLFLATVDDKFEAVRVYSVTPALACFWKKSALPFKITCTVSTNGRDADGYFKPSEGAVENRLEGCSHGDGIQWIVDLGIPILELTMATLNPPQEREKLSEVLRRWIETDRVNHENVSVGFAKLALFKRYRTNELPENDLVMWNYYFTNSDISIDAALKRISPIVGYLAHVLAEQHKISASRTQEIKAFIPVLELLESKGLNEGVGASVLRDTVGDTTSSG